MKINLVFFTVLTFSFISIFFTSCKKKENVQPETVAEETVSQPETAEEIKKPETKQTEYIPEKPFEIEEGISKFYIDERLADTMYVNSGNGLLIRSKGNSSATKIGRLPHGFPVKVVALGNQEIISNIKSYWVQIVIPDFTGEKKEPEFGWVYGEFLSSEIPEFSKPKTDKELEAYIAEMPVCLYNNWWPDSIFSEGQHTFYFYRDGNFDYYFQTSEEDIEKKASGKWKADSATHISLKADDLELDGFYVYNTSEDSFDSPDTDSAEDKSIAKGRRNISFGFSNERILKNYKYACKMNKSLTVPELETSISIREEAYKEYITELLASGVNLSGTQYEEEYHKFWNPIREKNKISPIEMSNAVEFGYEIPFSVEGIGCYVTPYENNSFRIYSDCYDDSTVTGYFEPGQTGIIKQVYTRMESHCPNVWMKILILDDGSEGWILNNSCDPEMLTTYKVPVDEKHSIKTSTMNASVSHSKSCMHIDEKAKRMAVSSSGNYILKYKDSIASVYQRNNEKPLAISDMGNDICAMTFSQDESKIYFALKNGIVEVTNLFMNSVEDIYIMEAENDFTYKTPRQIVVSHDQRYIFMEVTKNSHRREVPRIICYDTENRRLQEFDIRTPHDSQDGYYYYSKLIMNENNEVLVLATIGDSALVRFTPQKNGEIAMKQINFEHSDLSQPGFSPDNNGYILYSESPRYMVKVSEEGKIIEDSRKFLPDSRIDFTHGDDTIFYNKDYSIAAVFSESYRETTNYLTFFSTKTFNPLYTFKFYSDDKLTSQCFWTDNGILIYDSKNGNVQFHEIKIKEKKEQVSVSPKVTPKLLEICKGVSSLYREEVRGLKIGFSPFGQYIVTSYIHDYDDENLGYMSGSYKLDGPTKVILNKAFTFGPDLNKNDYEIYHGFSPANGRSAKIEITGKDYFGQLKISTFEFAK